MANRQFLNDKEDHLKEARDTIKKTAKPHDYLGSACAEEASSRSGSLDNLSPTATVIYPISLPAKLDRFGPSGNALPEVVGNSKGFLTQTACCRSRIPTDSSDEAAFMRNCPLVPLFEELLKAGYALDAGKTFWRKLSDRTIQFSDGELSESRTLQVIRSARDLRTGSDELASGMVDWPSIIHLSPERANLLRPLRHILKGRILEVGSGAGPLTRYLAETGATVFALEGNPHRATITAERCRDLPNVATIAGDVSTFQLNIRFDIITLVGVLEYSRIFTHEKDAVQAMLRRVRTLLAPGGYLVLAIENQLGLKYFAGAPEDHEAEAFFGVSDRYHDRSTVTFGRRELEEHLRSAGFTDIEFVYPFPDYKLPRLILTERAFSSRHATHLVELIRSIGLSEKVSYPRVFSENLAWRAIVRNNLGPALANSFLVIASEHQDPQAVTDPDVIGYTFSADRRRRFHVENRFIETHGRLHVTRTRLYNDEPPHVGLCRHNLSDSEFIPGVAYVNVLHELLQARNWSISDVQNWAKRYLNFLLERVGPHGAPAAIDPDQPWLPNNFVDCVPSNLVIASDGSMHVFDLEWDVTPPPSLHWVLFRGLFYSLWHAKTVAPPANNTPIAVLPLVLGVMRGIGYALEGDALKRVLATEEDFQRSAVGERSVLNSSFWIAAELHLRASDVVRTVQHYEQALTEATEKLGLQDKINSVEWSAHVEELKARLAELTAAQEDAQQLISDLGDGFKKHSEDSAEWSTRVGQLEARLAELTAAQEDVQQLISDLGDGLKKHSEDSAESSARARQVMSNVGEALKTHGEQAAAHATMIQHLERRLTELERSFWRRVNDSIRKHVHNAATLFLRVRQRTLFRAIELRFLMSAANRRVVRRLRVTGLVDSAWYTTTYSDIALLGIDPLVHFLIYGAAERRNPNLLFDTAFYLENNSDVTSSGMNPLWHYLTHGAAEGRNPHREFNSATYLDQNRDVAEAGANPLAHYLNYGRHEGRSIQPACVSTKASPPRAPDAAAWTQIRPRADSQPAEIDIVIPVYRGYDETLGCIFSVLTAPVCTPHEVIVIDDCSPDVQLAAELRRLADLGLIYLLRNEVNLGFVRSVNRGLELHSSRDVVLLNADTLVYNDWLDRLRKAAHSAERIGTATPLSNNATICSYPRFLENNDTELEVPFPQLDALAASVNAGVCIPIPTAVGFCMYVRRDCLNETGSFDAARFGTGYGEENDFCLRASHKHWYHVLAADVFVRHYGSVSFGASSAERLAAALKRLLERFPQYNTLIHDFIQADPIASVRRNLDIARMRRCVGPKPFLFVSNSLGGGTDRHLIQMAGYLEREGVGVLLARADRFRADLIELAPMDSGDCVTQKYDLTGDASAFVEVLLSLNVQLVHCHHVIGFDAGITTRIPDLAARAGIRFDVTLHDYTAICPRVFLLNGDNQYCGEPHVTTCNACVERHGSRFGVVRVDAWRERFRVFLASARNIYVPSQDVAVRIRHYFPSAHLVVRPHPERIPTAAAARAVQCDRLPRNIAVIGAIGPHKGFHVLHSCAADAMARHLPLRFVVIGYTADDHKLSQLSNVFITGKYDDDCIDRIFADHPCELAWFPAVWPETYSYTLSHALRAGLYPVTFDVGAQAERIRRIGWGSVLPLEMSSAATEINNILLNVDIGPALSPVADWGAHYPSMLQDYYELHSERSHEIVIPEGRRGRLRFQSTFGNT